MHWHIYLVKPSNQTYFHLSDWQQSVLLADGESTTGLSTSELFKLCLAIKAFVTKSLFSVFSQLSYILGPNLLLLLTKNDAAHMGTSFSQLLSGRNQLLTQKMSVAIVCSSTLSAGSLKQDKAQIETRKVSIDAVNGFQEGSV